MKRICFALALLLALLCACGEKTAVTTAYDVLEDGEVYTVDREAGTITRGGTVYRYKMEGRTVTITYPGGGTYWLTYTDDTHSSYGAGWDITYENQHDIDGSTLARMLEREEASQGWAGNPLGLLVAALGLWPLLSPRSVWYLNYGWRYKNAEPSEVALVVERLTGVIFVLLGAWLLFFG